MDVNIITINPTEQQAVRSQLQRASMVEESLEVAWGEHAHPIPIRNTILAEHKTKGPKVQILLVYVIFMSS